MSALLAACTAQETETPAAPTTIPLADQAAYVQSGPYVAGTTTLDMGGRIVEVWYPADEGSQEGIEPDVFEIRDLLPEPLKAIVPDELNPRYVTDAYRDIPVSEDGPFPLVIFAHGFAAYPTEYQFLLTHLASWGFVVAGPDFSERGLLAAVTGTASRADETAVMAQVRELMAAQNETPGSILEGAVDATTVGTAGHSAGVVPAVGAAAADPNVRTFVAISGGRPPGGDATLPVPEKPGMVMTGGLDEVVPLERVRGFYDSLAPPKRLVVIDEAGHNSFNDLCLIGAEQGGLLEIARQVGIPVPDELARLFNDGCLETFLPPTETWPAARHFVTAQLRYELGVDPEPVGLGPGVTAAFAPVAVTYEQTP